MNPWKIQTCATCWSNWGGTPGSQRGADALGTSLLQPHQGQGAYLHLSFPEVGERGEGPFLSRMLLLGVGGGGQVVGSGLYLAFVFGAGRRHSDLCHLL